MTFEEQLYRLDDVDDLTFVKKKEAMTYIIKMAKIMTRLLDLFLQKKEILLEDLKDMDISDLEQIVVKMEDVITRLEEIQKD